MFVHVYMYVGGWMCSVFKYDISMWCICGMWVMCMCLCLCVCDKEQMRALFAWYVIYNLWFVEYMPDMCVWFIYIYI